MKIILLLLSLAGHLAFSESLINVDQLNKVLQQKHATWVAKPTAVNEKSRAEIKRMLGLDRDLSSAIEFQNSHAAVQADLPVVTDWRNKDGINWVTPVLDQANCGSCVAFASIATLETQYRIASGFSNLNVKLSPQYLFSCGGGYCDWGWQPQEAAQFLQARGTPDEACMPYTSGATGQDVACNAACPNSTSRMVKIASYATPSRGVMDLSSVKAALQKGPLVTTLEVYADFMAYGGGVYKHETGEMLGGHAVSIIGYDDAKQAYIVRNSWGETWGEKGFGFVSYEDVSGVGSETWSYSMPSLAGVVGIEAPVDYSYYSKTLDMKAQSTYAGTDSMTITAFDKTNMPVQGANCTGNLCESNFDISQMADGRYEVQANSFDAHGQTLGISNRQFFYVANQKPTMTLSYVGTNGTDLSKPLKDRIEVAVTATASNGLPLSSVTFHYRGPDGFERTRSASVVMAGLTMGWRTNLTANGNYEIWMTGDMKTNSYDAVVETAHKTVVTQN
jgi:C1A family cysteine protease